MQERLYRFHLVISFHCVSIVLLGEIVCSYRAVLNFNYLVFNTDSDKELDTAKNAKISTNMRYNYLDSSR